MKRTPAMLVLPAGIVVLITGLWGGLARLGYQLPADSTSAANHGILMSLGFLGTLISVERATALGRRWAWLTPITSVVGSIWVVAGLTPRVGEAFLVVAGIVLVAVYVALDRIQRSTHNTLMGFSAAGWAVGAALWLAGRDIASVVPWLAIFLVVTITAERLELSRLIGTSRHARVLLVAGVTFMFVGATVSVWSNDLGTRLTGAAMVALAAWLGYFDLARRTIRQRGVTRFMAAGLLAGYVWLAVGGILWLLGGSSFTAVYDARLHAVFLGFVMSMVFAHAPVIAPAVIRRPLAYSPSFYGPLGLLHAGLLLRILGGDAAGSTLAWQLGGDLNEIALLGFVAVTAGSLVLSTRRQRAKSAATKSRAEKQISDDAEPPRRSRRPLTSPIAAGVAIGIIVLVGAIVFANSGKPSSHDNAVAAENADTSSSIAVSLVEMKIEPGQITVAPGSHVVLRVTNKGTMRHDLRLSTGVQTPMLSPGQTAVLDAGIVTKDLTGWCTVPGHRAAGMKMTIHVSKTAATTPPPTADPSGATPAMDGMSGMGGMGAASASGPDAVSPDLSGAAQAGWTPVDAALPPASTGTVHNVTWHVEAVKKPVAPGVTQELWTFNGTVPGPVLHGHVGDTFNVTVVNDTDMTHNVDFHAESGPPAAVMAPIPPGSSRTYHFVAAHAGAWLYHCSVEPMLLHMGNGMYGAIIIDPPNLPPADAEYVLVGSEYFFGPQGKIGDYSKMLADRPDAVVFNGYPFAYQRAPLTAKAGELVRIWLVDAGPNRSLAFHVVGAQFTTTYLDGTYLLPRGATSGAAQTLPVDPGDGGFVELTFNQPGAYPFLSHAMADAVLGASGVFMVSPQ